jgi:hypothetical protein
VPKKKRRTKAKRDVAKKRIKRTKLRGGKPKPKVAARKPSDKQKKATGVRKAETPAGVVASVSLAAPTIAPKKPCLPLPEAVTLVRSCSKAPDDLPLSTQLGQLFPSATARNSFCQCVANGVPVSRSRIPCGAGNTLQDVVDAIAC